MRILTVANRYDRGGASRVAVTLHREFVKAGHQSVLVAGDTDLGYSADDLLALGWRGRIVFKLLRYTEQMVLSRLYSGRSIRLSFGARIFSERYLFGRFAPDVVHFHNAQPELGFRLSRNVSWARRRFWTLHDSWIFTGGCHVPGDCSGYEMGCAECPAVRSGIAKMFVENAFKRKHALYDNSSMRIIAPSRSVADYAKRSKISSNIKIIGNAVDVQKFWPVDKSVARQSLGWRQNCRTVLLGANFLDIAAKGIGELDALRAALKGGGEYQFVVFGRLSNARVSALPRDVLWLGHTANDDLLRIWYSAADVFVSLSHSETFGLTVAEAMACGTPVAAWGVGGLHDIVDSHVNGVLVEMGDFAALSDGLRWVLGRSEIGELAVAKIRDVFAADLIARDHIKAYRENWVSH